MTKILVIEDNKDNLELMVYLLKQSGYTITTAMNGQLGIKTAKDEKPNLIVCDIQMPVMNGYEVLKEVKEDAELNNIPIIAVTAYAMVGDRDKILAAGFDAYIEKPIDPENFVTEVEKLLPKTLHLEKTTLKEFAPEAKESPQLIKHGKKALVVDDSFENRELSKSLLESIGFRVTTAKTVTEALLILDKENFDLILSDFHMPDMDGLAFLKVVRELEKYNQIRFVVISSTRPSSQTIEELKRINSNRFILRPIEPDEFLKSIKQLFPELYATMEMEK